MVNRTARSTACARAKRTERMTASRDPLRVALSMLTLVPGRMDGGATYARELVRTLGRSATVEATAFVSRAAVGFSADVTERVVNGVTGGASTPRVRTLVEAGLIHRGAIRRAQAGFDVVHAPFTIAVPPAPSGVPLVQTMFDLQHLDLPQFFSRAQLIYRKYFYERTARKAAAVITISEFSKDRIIHHLGVAPERVFVAHLGVDTSAFTPYLGERENFLLYPATAGGPQKPCKPHRGAKYLARARPNAAARTHWRCARLARRAPGLGRRAGGRPRRGAAVVVWKCPSPRLPQPLRRLRSAPARSYGGRLSRGVVERGVLA